MCDPITALVAIGTGATVLGQVNAAEDAEDAYHAQSMISAANAQHRREISRYNASIFTEQATRLRNEQIGRLNEVAGINIERLDESRSINSDRVYQALGINTERVTHNQNLSVTRANQDAERVVGYAKQDIARVTGRADSDFMRTVQRTNKDRDRNIKRIEEVASETIKRLGRRASEVATRGFEEEGDFRKSVMQRVSSQRSFFAAGNIVISSGTPMSLQLD